MLSMLNETKYQSHVRVRFKFYWFLAKAPVLLLLNETKYQLHVRVRVRFRSGACRIHGSCPVRVVCVWFVMGLLSGFVPGSCPVRVRFVSGSCPSSCPVGVRVRVRSCLVSVWVRVWFASVSYPGS